MTDREDDVLGAPEDSSGVPTVAARLRELQRRKRGTVRWDMSRDTAERAIAAITERPPSRPAPGRAKSRRRKRHKRLL
jgi:hypothetical protein